MSNRIRVTKLQLEAKARSNRNVGFTNKGQRVHKYACASPVHVCGAKFDPKVKAVAHGSPGECQRCIKKALAFERNFNEYLATTA